jgi:hypothetical protein
MGLPSPPRVGRQLTVPPREVHQAQQAARAEQNTPDWQARYAVRAGFERAVRQGVAVTELRPLPRAAHDRLHHLYSAVPLNLIRLHASWNRHPLDRIRFLSGPVTLALRQ